MFKLQPIREQWIEWSYFEEVDPRGEINKVRGGCIQLSIPQYLQASTLLLFHRRQPLLCVLLHFFTRSFFSFFFKFIYFLLVL